MKKTLTILFYIFFVIALAMIALRFYYKFRHAPEKEDLYAWLAFAFLIPAFIIRILLRYFPGIFRNKTENG